jgi:cytoskeletal protein RodZ
MSDLGARLKDARQARGLSLRDIEATTKISVVALEALERHEYGRLPGGIFNRAFVRAYAKAVGLDPEATVHEFVAEYERWEREAQSKVIHPEITPDDLEFLERQRRALRTLRIGIVVLALCALAALAYVGLIWWPALKAPGG